MMLECHDRRERPQPVDLHENLGAEHRVRLDQFSFAPVERAGLLDDFERDPRLADVVQERGFDERGDVQLVQPELLAEQQAQHRDVDRVAVRQVLVHLDGENLAQRGVAARHAVDEQLHEIADRHEIELLAGGGVVEGFLRQHQRLGIVRIERAGRSVRPLPRAPSRVERHDLAEADVLDVPARQLLLDRLGMRVPDLPEKLSGREQFVAPDAFAHVNAVDPEIAELAHDLRARRIVTAERHAVQERRRRG